MKLMRFIAVALAAVFVATGAAAQDKVQKEKKLPIKIVTKAQLKKENLKLQSELDSLKAEIERYRIEDSLAHEIMGIYEEQAEEVTLSPEDYTVEVSDSLLDLWYAHKKVCEYGFDEEYDMDSVRFESNVPDSVYIKRIEAMNSFITLPYNDIVKNYIILYSEKMPTKMSHILGLCEYYMPIFQETFNRHDMPEELKAMAVIESALNPTAVSRAGAKGMWQFMYSTAKSYGLTINSFVDERLDPVKSAEAAAQYLQDSYEIFGDWNLAIASYNCGAGNVNKAIRRSGGKRAFWDIWPYLPRETRGYVPAFVGALYTMTYYKEHGIRPESVQMPAHIDTLHINRQMHFKQVSELTGAPLDELKNLNPQYRHEIVPGNEKEYIFRLPYKYTNAFIEHEDTLYTYKAEEFFNPVTIKKIKDGGDGERIVYRVKSGDYLGRIASRHGCTVAQIKRWNNLRSNNIRIGQRLIIYRNGKAPSAASSSSASGSSSTGAKQAPASASTDKGSYIEYTVRSGDSFYSISKDYPGVSAQNIMDYNGLSSSKIKPGMKIKIPKK